jgi:hypothetical protein
MTHLNPEQRVFVYDNDFRYRKLYGVAGGGKTRCIIEKICELKRVGYVADSNDYLVLTFSRQACQDFITKGMARDKTLFNTRCVRTIHSACSSILYNNQSDAYKNITTLVYETVEWLGRNEIKREPPWMAKACIFVDEAQDISAIQYDFVSLLAKIYKCPLVLVGDPNQTIFQFQNGSDRFLLEHEGEPVTLKMNYRSTSQIVSFLNHFRPRSEYGLITAFKTEVAAKKPQVFVAETETCLANLLTQIARSPYPLHEMAIIAPIKLNRSYCLSLSIVANYLNTMQIPFVKHYQDSEQDTGYKKVKEVHPGRINLYTIHGSKGLEYKKVFLFNFHFYTKAFQPTKEDFLENKFLWYVGLSRAIDEVVIYALPDNILFPTIYTCDTQLYATNAPIVPKEYTFSKDDHKNIVYSVKNFINTKTLLSEEKLYHLNSLFKATVVAEELYHLDIELYEADSYSILYGIFVDEWVFYRSVNLTRYVLSKKRWFNTKIPLPKYLYKHIKGRMKRRAQIHYYDDFMRAMNAENDLEHSILRIIQHHLVDRSTYFDFVLDTNVCTYNQSLYYSFLDALDKDAPLLAQIEALWRVMLFQYQLDYECKYLLETDFSTHCQTLLPYVSRIERVVSDFDESTLFQSPVCDSEIHLKGIMDGLDRDNVIHEFKFCSDITLQDHLQVYLYALIHYNHLYDRSVVLWNFKTGKRYTTTFSADIDADTVRSFIKNIFVNIESVV